MGIRFTVQPLQVGKGQPGEEQPDRKSPTKTVLPKEVEASTVLPETAAELLQDHLKELKDLHLV